MFFLFRPTLVAIYDLLNVLLLRHAIFSVVKMYFHCLLVKCRNSDVPMEDMEP